MRRLLCNGYEINDRVDGVYEILRGGAVINGWDTNIRSECEC